MRADCRGALPGSQNSGPEKHEGILPARIFDKACHPGNRHRLMGAFPVRQEDGGGRGVLVGMSAVAPSCRPGRAKRTGQRLHRGHPAGQAALSEPLAGKEKRFGHRPPAFQHHEPQKRSLKPLNPGKATMYACGPGLHRNLAHCRRFVVADLILALHGVSRGTNGGFLHEYTDLDDNTIAGAMQAGLDLKAFTTYISISFERAAAWGCGCRCIAALRACDAGR